MDPQTRLDVTIQWTRTFTLVLSILIFISSLSIYSNNTVPITSLLATGDSQQLFRALIIDRRLITTLVAAQSSIFAPLLLLSTQQEQTILDRACQCVMPLGPCLGWAYCLFFDEKTAGFISPRFDPMSSLKYLVIISLAMESIQSCLSWIRDVKNTKSPLLI